jgi:hypothetical protein
MDNNRKIGIALAVTLVAIGVSFVLHGTGPRLGVDAVGVVAFAYAWRLNRRAKKGARR